jgi:hypothetical protein
MILEEPLTRNPFVGASLLAKIFEKFASKLAPTGGADSAYMQNAGESRKFPPFLKGG